MTSAGIASRYAHALIDALTSPNSGRDPQRALESLNQFVESMNGAHDLEAILLSPSISPQRKRAVIEWLAGKLELDPLVRNLLYVLSDHRRMPLVREVSHTAALLLDERLGFLRADLAAAAPLSDDDQRQIADRLSNITGKRIRLNLKIDPDLIGGVIARVGSTVYDGSVKGRLRALGERLAAE